MLGILIALAGTVKWHWILASRRRKVLYIGVASAGVAALLFYLFYHPHTLQPSHPQPPKPPTTGGDHSGSGSSTPGSSGGNGGTTTGSGGEHGGAGHHCDTGQHGGQHEDALDRYMREHQHEFNGQEYGDN